MDYHDYQINKKADFWHRARFEFLAYLLEKHLPSGSTPILDIGSGTGFLLPLLKRFGPVTAVDNSPEAVQIARAHGITVIKKDIKDFGINPEEFGAVTAFDVLEHLNEDLACVKKIFRGLKTGGCILATVPAYQFLFGPHDIALEHQRRYSKKQLIALLDSAGFEIVEAGYWNFLLFPLEAAFRIIKKITCKIKKPKPEQSESHLFPPIIDNFLHQILGLDLSLIKSGLSLPFGLTTYAIGRKKNPRQL